MKSSKVISAVVVSALAVMGAMSLVACSGAPGAGSSGGVAATVNGTEISEDKVTDYIQDFRTTQGVDDNEGWGTWLSNYGMAPADIRSDVIDHFVDQELIKAAAAEKNIEVTDEEVDEQVNQMKANYADDAAWQEALSQVGTTEESYRDNVREAMVKSKLEEAVKAESDAEVTDEKLLEQASAFGPYFDGAKRSSHILFNAEDKELAEQTLERINNGEISFEDAVAEYSQDEGSAANGGDVGWDMLNSFVSEYTDALAKLDKDQTSGLVTSDYGFHIIRCTDVFHAPEEITSLDQLPSELVEYIRSMVASSAETEAYDTWFAEYKEKADVKINDMPSGLPYDIDPKYYQTEATEGEAAEGEATEGEAAEGEATEGAAEGEGAEATADAAAEDGTAAEGEAATDAEATEASAEGVEATAEGTEANTENAAA